MVNAGEWEGTFGDVSSFHGLLSPDFPEQSGQQEACAGGGGMSPLSQTQERDEGVHWN